LLDDGGRHWIDNLLVAGAGLSLIGLFLVLVVFASRFAYCTRTGKCASKDSGAITQVGYCGAKNYPSISEELGGGERHPISVDLERRLKQQFESAPEFRDIFIFRACVFLDFYYKPEDNYYLASYQWNGSEWEFIALECETCQ